MVICTEYFVVTTQRGWEGGWYLSEWWWYYEVEELHTSYLVLVRTRVGPLQRVWLAGWLVLRKL